MKTGNRLSVFLVAICLILLLAASCSSTKTLVILLPSDDTANGSITLGEGDQTTVLDAPMTAAEVDARGRVKKTSVNNELIDQYFKYALAAQPPDPITFLLYFKEGSTELSQASTYTLPELFKEIENRQAVEVQVTGHTDRLDSEASNDLLSIERAQVIKEILISKGLKAGFIRTVGRGERELLIKTPDGVREPLNRRVEVIIR